MNNSGNSRSQPPRAIRAGLSVQELKAMTAARIAQSGEPQPRIQQYNPATSYQTANPQQLQAAGITPIVINDRSRTLRNFRPNSLSSIELEPLQTTSHANLPHPSSRNGLSQLSPYHQQILPRRSPPQDHAHGPRDTYYNSNSSTHFEGSDNHLWNQRSPVRDFPSSHSERLENSLFGGGKSLSSRNENVFGSFEPHTDLTPRTPGGLLPALNTSPRYVRGPEVRSPATGERPVADRYFIPDEESEHYSMDSLFSSLNLGPSATSSENLNFGSKKVPLSRALSNPVIQPEGGSFTLPHAGAHVISSSFLPSVSPVQNGNVFPQSQVDNGRSDNLAYDEPNESGNSKFLEPARFPFKKSKTAPKLGIISSAGINSPVDSPSVKIFARKHAGHPVNLSPLRDRTSLDSNFLASEVAEAVLDTPSTGSTPLGRKFFPQDAIPALRKGFSNSSIQPIDLTPESTKGYFANGSFYGASAVRDDRLEWSISDPVEDNPQFHVSNQCESDDTEDRVIERSLRPDSPENRLHRRIIHAGTNRNLPSLD